jgi:Holliday junction resolvase
MTPEAKAIKKLKKIMADSVLIRMVCCGSIGMPDFVAVSQGSTFFIEVKSSTGKLSKAQIIQHERIRKAGGCVFVYREGTGFSVD